MLRAIDMTRPRPEFLAVDGFNVSAEIVRLPAEQIADDGFVLINWCNMTGCAYTAKPEGNGYRLIF